MKIINGVLQGVKFIESPNHGGIINPRFIIKHYTAGWTAASAIATLTNPETKVSAQFVVDRDGTITQLVRCDRRAWHAGPSAFMGYKDLNSHAIGIEYVNPGFVLFGPNGSYLTPHPDPKKRTVIPSATIEPFLKGSIKQRHSRIGSAEVLWLPYTEAQIEAGRQITKAACDAYDILGVGSHEEIDTRGWKTDPGPLFPLGEFKALVDKFEGRAGSPPRPGAVPMAIVTASSLNVRAAPGGTVVGKLLKGDTVIIHEDRGDWCLVHGGRLPKPAWVSDLYLDHS